MIRFFFILASLLAMQYVVCQDGASLKMKPPPPTKPLCTGVFCRPCTERKTAILLQKALDECSKCLCKKNGKIDWETFCNWYTNWDPKNQKFLQCIINRFTNPCYKLYHQMQETLDDGCGKICHHEQFDFYTLISDICYNCNGCWLICALQTVNIVWYRPDGVPGVIDKKGGAATTAAGDPDGAPVHSDPIPPPASTPSKPAESSCKNEHHDSVGDSGSNNKNKCRKDKH
ncbi:uncharacterized protein LOC129572856 [Sitodiplosis mosellana]|uniref:uncharacterized protein LOC129572856 n=1 Tax=Sitodiplosis mosellana TaxID=263140 RepID=UPI002444EE64|nr:uncharacterized protein LOC129572856 [Sitodiplosis mosellana]